MSFRDSAFGSALDYGELLPRRAKRALAMVFVGLMVFAPDTFNALLMRYAEAQAARIEKIFKAATPQSASTPPATTTP